MILSYNSHKMLYHKVDHIFLFQHTLSKIKVRVNNLEINVNNVRVVVEHLHNQ